MNIGDNAPEILGKDEQGRDIRLSDYKDGSPFSIRDRLILRLDTIGIELFT